MATAKALEIDTAWKEFRAVKLDAALERAGVRIPSPSDRLSGFKLDRQIRKERALEISEISNHDLQKAGGLNPLGPKLQGVWKMRK